MMTRCYNENFEQFKDYGGRGIQVCEPWHSFENFVSDMGTGKRGWTLHRVDNDGDYTPSNVVWATMAFQNRHRSDNRMVIIRGFTGCLMDACERFKKEYMFVLQRLNRGWDAEEAFFTPKLKSKHGRSHYINRDPANGAAAR